MAFDGRLLGGISVLAAVVETGNFVRAAESLQKIGITGVELGVVRFDPQRVFKMGPRLFQFFFAKQDCRQIDVRLCGTRIKT